MDKNNRSKLDLLAHEVLAWRRQGKSYRSIEKLLKEEHDLKISYRTVQTWLVRKPSRAGRRPGHGAPG
jgi:intein-encoded DNA endonuclease-like protein